MYLLSDFAGFAETQFPTEGDEKVAFMATVGSTQRVISRSSNRYLDFRCATSSRVRTKCHIPFRKLGPSNPSALAWDESGPTAISAIARQKKRKRTRGFAKPLQQVILSAPIVPS